MVERLFWIQKLELLLAESPVVAMLGPRQVGKTTLAQQVTGESESIYLDMEAPSDIRKMTDPELFLRDHTDKLVILDEIQRLPEIFQVLRGLVDQGRRRGREFGQFLLLGSAAPELLRQSSESLAGRISYVELTPFDVCEVGAVEQVWLRGGFPGSFLAKSDAASFRWRSNFIRTYIERDIPQLGPRIPSETLQRFWTMLAHHQGGLLNAAALARNLAVDGKTISNYLDLFVDLLLVRRLQPWHGNVGKRLVRSPKVFIRDSGLLHQLLGITDKEILLGHPVVGASWEGFVIEQLQACLPDFAKTYFYRTATGVEIDFVIEMGSGERVAIEIKRSLSPKVGKGFHVACDDLKADRRFILYPGTDCYPLDASTRVIGLEALGKELRQLSTQGFDWKS